METGEARVSLRLAIERLDFYFSTERFCFTVFLFIWEQWFMHGVGGMFGGLDIRGNVFLAT